MDHFGPIGRDVHEVVNLTVSVVDAVMYTGYQSKFHSTHVRNRRSLRPSLDLRHAQSCTIDARVWDVSHTMVPVCSNAEGRHRLTSSQQSQRLDAAKYKLVCMHPRNRGVPVGSCGSTLFG